jgi:hypothetical protein
MNSELELRVTVRVEGKIERARERKTAKRLSGIFFSLLISTQSVAF